MPEKSAVFYLGKEKGSSCGYCKSEDGFITYGKLARRNSTYYCILSFFLYIESILTK